MTLILWKHIFIFPSSIFCCKKKSKRESHELAEVKAWYSVKMINAWKKDWTIELLNYCLIYCWCQCCCYVGCISPFLSSVLSVIRVIIMSLVKYKPLFFAKQVVGNIIILKIIFELLISHKRPNCQIVGYC